jgi:hypothetical protein
MKLLANFMAELNLTVGARYQQSRTTIIDQLVKLIHIFIYPY